MDQNTPRLSDRVVVYENKFQQIYHVTADFGYFSKEYFVLDTGVRAGIVVVKQDAVLLVRQYRLLANGLSWEIPGGKVDCNELPEEAAVRECLEETGIRCSNPRPLIFYHASLDTTHNPVHLFYSSDITEAGEKDTLVVNEEVRGAEWVPFSRCLAMVSEGMITDSFSIIALLAYQLRLASGVKPQP